MTESAQPPLALEAWLARLDHLLPADVVATAGAEEQTLLLDLARIAAHGSERIAAPITTYLAGVAFGSLPQPDRLERFRALVRALEA
jgi:hypothetical protein